MNQDSDYRKVILLLKISVALQGLIAALLLGFIAAQFIDQNKGNSDYQKELAEYHKLIDNWKKENQQNTEK